MAMPKGFDDLVKVAMKERPPKPKTREEVWEKFLYVVFMGGRRGDPDINFLLNALKKYTGLDYVLKTDGEDWREEVGKALSERMQRIKDDDMSAMLKDFQKEIFRISASIKGSARFFERNSISPETLENMLNNKDRTWEFIEELVKDEDVPNIRYTKIIIWLHSLGFAHDFCAPSWQTKSFVNEIYGYYQFYDDEKYFMKKAGEISEDVRKRVKGATARDVATAIFYYVSVKGMLPLRSKEKKNFTPGTLVRFLRAKKLTLEKVSEELSEYDGRKDFMEKVYAYLRKA